jgi:NADH:ubiquinone oxidoreductase subunit 6 (subunit J)
MEEYLSFRKMITPMLIQVFFWIGVVFVVIASLVMMFKGGIPGFLGGLVYLVLGPIFVRIYCELIIVLFKIFEELKALREGLVPTQPTGFPVVSPIPGIVPPPPPPVAR